MFFNIETLKLREIYNDVETFKNSVQTFAPAWFVEQFIIDADFSATFTYALTLIFFTYENNYILNVSENIFKQQFALKIISSFPVFLNYLKGDSSGYINNDSLGAFSFTSDTNSIKDNSFKKPDHYSNYSFNQASGKELDDLIKWKDIQIDKWIGLFSSFFQPLII